MRLFGLDISRAKAPQLQAVGDRGGWWRPIVGEPWTGAWQRHDKFNYHNTQSRETALAFAAVYAAVTLIASDIAKLRPRIVERIADGTWLEVSVAAFSPVLRKPNPWQTRIAFFQQWLISKLLSGNAYVLKARDGRGVVTALYVLDPARVQALVTPDGDVYYNLSQDTLSGLTEASVVVPASEIIHDVMNPLFHPLVGVSPLMAAGTSAMHGLTIQSQQHSFFKNNSRPSGLLTAPGTISQETADRLKNKWEENYAGENAGRVAVMGDGLKYESMTITPADAQLIEQLRWDETNIATAFRIPEYMITSSAAPAAGQNVQALQVGYYSQCLQIHIESVELLLEEGIGLPDVTGHTYGVEFDLDQLLRMDTATLFTTIAEGMKGGFLAPNEGRARIGLGPVDGGESPYLQQQNFSLAALAKRDAQADPFATAKPPEAPTVPAIAPPEPPPVAAGLTDDDVLLMRDVLAAELRATPLMLEAP